MLHRYLVSGIPFLSFQSMLAAYCVSLRGAHLPEDLIQWSHRHRCSNLSPTLNKRIQQAFGIHVLDTAASQRVLSKPPS